MRKTKQEPRATVGVAELKARLSRYLDRVKNGHEVVVTKHGHPVARVIPIPDQNSQDARIARLIRKGLLIPPRKRPDPAFLKRFPPIHAPGADLVGEVIRERDERR